MRRELMKALGDESSLMMHLLHMSLRVLFAEQSQLHRGVALKWGGEYACTRMKLKRLNSAEEQHASCLCATSGLNQF